MRSSGPRGTAAALRASGAPRSPRRPAADPAPLQVPAVRWPQSRHRSAHQVIGGRSAEVGAQRLAVRRNAIRKFLIGKGRCQQLAVLRPREQGSRSLSAVTAHRSGSKPKPAMTAELVGRSIKSAAASHAWACSSNLACSDGNGEQHMIVGFAGRRQRRAAASQKPVRCIVVMRRCICTHAGGSVLRPCVPPALPCRCAAR